jgi:hypothetical protein
MSRVSANLREFPLKLTSLLYLGIAYLQKMQVQVVETHSVKVRLRASLQKLKLFLDWQKFTHWDNQL